MGNGNEQLNAIFMPFVEQVIIELQTFFIRFQFITVLMAQLIADLLNSPP
ncbi:UNVERIFIED_CONTAM: hypothetical protein ABIC26_001232 [Paenibacillus sp. PvR008]